MKKYFYILVLILIFPHLCLSDKENSGNIGLQFLEIGPDARAASLGNSYASIGRGVGSIYYNPALLSGLKNIDIIIDYTYWLKSLNYLGFFYGNPIKKLGAFSIGITSLLYSTKGFTSTSIDNYGNIIDLNNNFSAFDIAIWGSYGIRIHKYIALGLNLKLIIQKLDDKSAISFNTDLGMLINKENSKWGIGIAVRNIGTKSRFVNEGFRPPINIKSDVHYVISIKKIHKIIPTMGLVVSIFDSDSWNMGLEYAYRKIIALRIGGQAGGNSPGIHLGVGSGFNIFDINYTLSFIRFKWITHRLSLNLLFKTTGKRNKYKRNRNKQLKPDSSIDKDDAPDIMEIIDEDEQIFNNGLKLFDEEEYTKASEEFNKIPIDSEYYEKARLYIKKSDKLYNEGIQKIIDKGLEHYKNGMYNEALEEWNKIPVDSDQYNKVKIYIKYIKDKLKINDTN